MQKPNWQLGNKHNLLKLIFLLKEQKTNLSMIEISKSGFQLKHKVIKLTRKFTEIINVVHIDVIKLPIITQRLCRIDNIPPKST